MKAKVVMNQLILESEFTFEQLKKIKKFKPEVLTLPGQTPESTPDFTVFLEEGAKAGAASNFAIILNETSNAGKAATIIDLNAPKNEDIKHYAAECYGVAVQRAGEVEEAIGNILADVEQIAADVEASIEVIA